MITTTTKKKVGTNEVYSEAWDLPDSGFAYEETDQLKDIDNLNIGGN